MKLALVGGFCEMEELCRRAGHEIVHIVNAGEDADYQSSGDRNIPLVVTPDGPVREKISESYRHAGFSFVTVIAQTADVSPSASVGEGTVIAERAVVTAATKVGRFVKINTAACVTHECVIGDYATIAPAAVILGRVTIGVGAYVGANATVLPGIKIGKNATVGAGAVVTKDVPEGATVVGVPARVLEKREKLRSTTTTPNYN